MEAHEIAEQINEHSEASSPPRPDWFRRITAIYVSVTAICGDRHVGGAEATKEC